LESYRLKRCWDWWGAGKKDLKLGGEAVRFGAAFRGYLVWVRRGGRQGACFAVGVFI
jgi:hypothetical protein